MCQGWMRRFAVLAIAATSTLAIADDLTGRDLLQATLWMQRAAEYRVISTQVYRLATEKLATPEAGSAAPEQQGVAPEVLARLPTAVVLDLDETVLDNTVYQARLLRDRANYDARSWGEWVGAGEAEAIPGAREFIAEARRLGHTVFYVTNRDCNTPAPTAADKCPAKTATMRNLVQLGIDPRPDPERLLLRAERPEWNSSAKGLRRAFIAANYRIVAMVGDDLGDFVEPKIFAGDRERLEPRFGVSWFLLPNPIYGSWSNPFDTVEKKYSGLRTDDPVLELPGGGIWNAGAGKVRIASWNVEYLMTPATHLALRDDCAENGGRVGGDDRTLPCAITKREPRGADDYASLRHYAATLAADIVALQEVDGPAAAAQVFPGYDYCFSTRAHTQKNGFAIRRGLPFRCEPEYLPLSLDNAVRRGVVATFFPGTDHEFRLMSVHLKSGCPEGPLTAEGRNCELLSRQVEPLKSWIEAEARAGHRFGVLGDFNRRFTLEKGAARDEQGRLAERVPGNRFGRPGRPRGSPTSRAGNGSFPVPPTANTATTSTTSCSGASWPPPCIRKSFVRVVFNDQDASQHWLSDHCPVGIELRLR